MKEHQTVLRLIGVFKLLKGILLAAAAIAALKLLHRDVGEVILEWAGRLHVAPGNPHLQRLLVKVYSSHRELKFIPIVFGIYSAMFLTEGVGLVLARPWAEWMTVITTSGLIPIEVFELYRRFTSLKLAIFAINVAIAIYLVRNLIKPQDQAQLKVTGL
jgi:uncharacterized membrane protein (DUF2068 family)